MSSGMQQELKETTDLEEGLGPRGPHLEHDGQDGEDDDLDGGAPRVPVRPADTVLSNMKIIVICRAQVQVPMHQT